jgi:hypothetical protein
VSKTQPILHGEDLLGVFVEKQMVVPKVSPAHVPVEVLRLYIEREHVSKHMIKRD